jgi:hypothetical protein
MPRADPHMPTRSIPWRVGKPLLFIPPLLAPYFNGYYHTGYMQMLGHEKID